MWLINLWFSSWSLQLTRWKTYRYMKMTDEIYIYQKRNLSVTGQQSDTTFSSTSLQKETPQYIFYSTRQLFWQSLCFSSSCSLKPAIFYLIVCNSSLRFHSRFYSFNIMLSCVKVGQNSLFLFSFLGTILFFFFLLIIRFLSYSDSLLTHIQFDYYPLCFIFLSLSISLNINSILYSCLFSCTMCVISSV